MPEEIDLTNYLYLHLPSSPSLGRHQRDQTWRSSEGGVGILRQYRQRDRHGHGHSAYGSESLKVYKVRLADPYEKPSELGRSFEGMREERMEAGKRGEEGRHCTLELLTGCYCCRGPVWMSLLGERLFEI